MATLNSGDFALYLKNLRQDLFKKSTVITINDKNDLEFIQDTLTDSDKTEMRKLFSDWKEKVESK